MIFRGFITAKTRRAPRIFGLVFGLPGAGVGGISLKQGMLARGKKQPEPGGWLWGEICRLGQNPCTPAHGTPGRSHLEAGRFWRWKSGDEL